VTDQFTPRHLNATALRGLPEVRPGDDLAELIVAALGEGEPPGALRDGQILAVAH
jgi:F420-0:gamma-glutamyl ligase